MTTANYRPKTTARIAATLWLSLVYFAARADDETNQYRLVLLPSHPLFGSREWIASGDLEYWDDPQKESTSWYLGLGATWKFSDRAEWWFDAIGIWTDNENSADTEEFRPQIGYKNYFRHHGHFRFYNFARAEYRFIHTDGSSDTDYLRLRDRLGVEVPFSRQGSKRDWYWLTDAEVFYRVDESYVDQARLRVGLGWIVNDSMQAEFIYTMQFTSNAPGDNLDWTENIWRLNFKLAHSQGLLRRLWHIDDED